MMIVTLLNTSLPAVISLVDLSGKLVLKRNVTAHAEHHVVDLKGFAGGTYMLKVNQGAKEQIEQLVLIRE